jgi:hypothetical protein
MESVHLYSIVHGIALVLCYVNTLVRDKTTIHKVDQVFINELNSDHVIMSIKIIHSKGGNKNKTPKINHKENYMKRGIQNTTK